jgi:phosphate uptake regulator
MITSIMFKEAIDSLIDGDKELAKDAITREYEADTITGCYHAYLP